MKHNRDDFFRLIDAIEAQGGSLLDKAHDVRVDERLKDERRHPVQLTSCGEVGLFEIPYESSLDESPRTIVACTIDDRVDLWPRFQEVPA